MVSNCCKAEIKNIVSDEGTGYMECTRCLKPADIYMKTNNTDWEGSTKTRVAGLLGLIGAVNLMDDHKEQEKQLKEGVKAFLKGNKAMVEDLLQSQKAEILDEVIEKINGIKGWKGTDLICKSDIIKLLTAMRNTK